MTDGPKSRWGFNSVLNDVKDKEEKADKAKNDSVKADVNGGAPDADAPMSDNKKKNLLKLDAEKNPNPNAKPEDPETDPTAAAARANIMEDASAAKTAAKETKKAALMQIGEDDPTKIESVRGPPGAPIGYGVHKLAIEGGAPYAGKQMYRAEEPVPGVQHQPVILPADFYRGQAAAPEKLSPEMQYRTDVGSEGVKAEDATYDKLVAAGMTDTPKVRFNNSILAPEANATADAKAAPADAAAPAAPAAPVAPAAALMQKQDTIGEPKYDYSVYDFSHKAIYDPLEKGRAAEGPFMSNGWNAGKWSLAQRNKHDISDKNIDEEVVGFVRADKNTVPIPLARRDSAYPINGWDNKPPSTINYSQRSTKDISDKNIDEEVVGFVRADKNMMPIPQFARRTTAYPVNGYANTPPSVVSNLVQRNTKDISDKNIDEEVVGFVRADKNMMPIPQFARRTTAYPVNGYANTPPSTVSDLVQRSTKDISDQNIDEEVVGMVRADKNMMPIPQFARRTTAYPVNGYANTPPSVVSNLAQKRDISQPGVEPNVYDFVHDKVEALNWERRPEPFNNNGFQAGQW